MEQKIAWRGRSSTFTFKPRKGNASAAKFPAAPLVDRSAPKPEETQAAPIPATKS